MVETPTAGLATGIRIGSACRCSSRRAWCPSEAPCERFSELAHVAHVGLPAARVAAALEALALAASDGRRVLVAVEAARVGMSSSSRSRRASAPGRLTISRRGQPRRSAPRKCLRMFGYSALSKTSRWTPRGFVHRPGSGCSRRRSPPPTAGVGRARARQVLAVDAVAVGVARVGGLAPPPGWSSPRRSPRRARPARPRRRCRGDARLRHSDATHQDRYCGGERPERLRCSRHRFSSLSGVATIALWSAGSPQTLTGARVAGQPRARRPGRLISANAREVRHWGARRSPHRAGTASRDRPTHIRQDPVAWLRSARAGAARDPRTQAGRPGSGGRVRAARAGARGLGPR